MSDTGAFSLALERLLEPLVQLMIRFGIPHGAFAELSKRVYVRVAEDEGGIAGRKQTVSRMSVLTGLSRKEISRLRKLPTQPATSLNARYHRAARVITGWIRDERYLDDSSEPRPLEFDGEGDSFSDLVKAFSGDVPPRAVLDELERVGTVRRDGDGKIHLLTRGYVPATAEEEKVQYLGSDVAGLISTIRHNLEPASDARFLQRKVFYDNLSEGCLPDLRSLAAEEGQKLLELLDRWMAGHDRDVNPEAPQPAGKRAGIGIYYFEEHHDEENSS